MSKSDALGHIIVLLSPPVLRECSVGSLGSGNEKIWNIK